MNTMSRRTKFFQFLQDLGKSFMFPVSTLAFMGLLVGLGSAFTAPSMIESLPFLEKKGIQFIFNFMNTIGGFGFTYLPVMFAMAIPFGLSKRNKAVGAIAAFAGYMAMNMSINFLLSWQGNLADADMIRVSGQSIIMGLQTLEMGVLGGVIVGLIVYVLHERFQDIVLHDAFAFFGGIRFVPIISILVLGTFGLIIPYIWPFFQSGIQSIGHLIQKAGIFGPFLYGLGVNILKPFGMHHILLALVRFTEAGGTEIIQGAPVSGALNIFYAQLNAGIEISRSATSFLAQGFMPTFMFGLPAICAAIYYTSYEENRSKIKGLLWSAILVSVVTGISEPTEFLFLFIAPTLYIFHSVMSGLSLMTMALIGVSIGNTDGGLLDWIIFGIMQGTDTRWYLLIPVGIIWFAIYFFVFKWYILKHNLETPGREDNVDQLSSNIIAKNSSNSTKSTLYDPEKILSALGEEKNIISLDNCVTRLRLQVNDADKVNEKELRKSGALAVIKLDNHNVQVVIGAQVQSVKDSLEGLINDEEQK